MFGHVGVKSAGPDLSPMIDAQLEWTTVGGVLVPHLGPLDAEVVLVVVGRNDYRKASQPINALAARFSAPGVAICWYEHKANQHARLREETYAAVENQWLGACMQRHPIVGFLLRKWIRLRLKIKYPKRHGYFFRKISLDPQTTTKDFRRFVRRLKSKNIFVVTHSAGGIAATQIESEASIKKIICFGYPFKHPDRPQEAYRTAHLRSLNKPLLILQGSRDEYGSAVDAARYPLSSTVRIESIDSGHDCDAINGQELERVQRLVSAFLGLGARDPPADQAEQGRTPRPARGRP